MVSVLFINLYFIFKKKKKNSNNSTQSTTFFLVVLEFLLTFAFVSLCVLI